jgi:hypothetical protein
MLRSAHARFAACLLVACAQPAMGQSVARLQVQPAALELVGAQDRQRLLVSAFGADGQVRDVTAETTITAAQPNLVSLQGNECAPTGDGSTTLTVSFGGQSVQVPVLTRDAKRPFTPSFVNDVQPILTRLGCNMGACHGKGAGQNGFRLSLRGYAPEWDHLGLTREFDSRRINYADPTASLLLQKPTGQAPHAGGVLMKAGGREYQVLLDWIQANTPGIAKDEPTVKRLELLPGDRVLKPGQSQPLIVRAEFSDGRIKEVTWLAQFDTNDGSVAEVSPTGVVKMLRSGETAVRATFMGQVAIAMLTAPFDHAVKAEWYAKQTNFIDQHVFKKLHDLRIEPSELCTDEEFLRRVHLDAMGLLPSPAEVRAFLADKSADKRAKLVDRVLARPEFVDFWTLQMADLLQNRKEADHDVRGSKGVRAFHGWIRDQVARNRPWDEMTRDLLTVTGSTHERPAVGYFVVNVGEHRESHQSTIVANVAQTFLGTRIGCAQCHNHPLEKYTQDDYYHFAGFLSRIKLDRRDPKTGATKLLVSMPDQNQNKNPVGVTQPRTHKFLPPQPLDRVATKIDPGQDPRQALADWIVNPKNEAFAGAMVNRLWAHFFSAGLVEPIDDLRASNPPTNPELWKALVKEFVEKKYDRKHMMRLILNSTAYQLSAKTKPSNEREKRFYSHYYARRLSAEVLADAIGSVTGVWDAFDGYPAGLRAVQIPDPAVKSPFLLVFNKSERITACACERNNDVALTHTLHLLGGNPLVAKLSNRDGRLFALLRANKSDTDILDDLFLASFGRLPRDSEAQRVLAHVRKDAATREEAYADVLWALLNSTEFLFNH